MAGKRLHTWLPCPHCKNDDSFRKGFPNPRQRCRNCDRFYRVTSEGRVAQVKRRWRFSDDPDRRRKLRERANLPSIHIRLPYPNDKLLMCGKYAHEVKETVEFEKQDNEEPHRLCERCNPAIPDIGKPPKSELSIAVWKHVFKQAS